MTQLVPPINRRTNVDIFIIGDYRVNAIHELIIVSLYTEL